VRSDTPSARPDLQQDPNEEGKRQERHTHKQERLPRREKTKHWAADFYNLISDRCKDWTIPTDISRELHSKTPATAECGFLPMRLWCNSTSTQVLFGQP